MLPDKDKVVRVMNYEKYRGNDIDQWLVIQAMLITNSDIHWVRHACHHYRESYERLNRRPSMTLESRKQFERVHRTLVMYVYGGLTIQKAWSAAGGNCRVSVLWDKCGGFGTSIGKTLRAQTCST